MRVSIISPEGVVFNDDVDQIVLPGSEGEFATLNKHSRLLSELKCGIITLYKDKTVTHKFTISGGYANISPTVCEILADSIENYG